MTSKLLNVMMTKSKIGRLKSHQQCLKGLGLRKIRHSVQVADTPENRGMINKVAYMLKVEEV
ncbi:50S ribosomal protein L30 [Methylomonas lenta]|jgi:large subunit ribosomal protein L30|uniref:Large ribosomal subunit protein uL30 n=1 Tax=Methylomonas lenta TaxID=980561 RepID=A0A177MYI8_9GAMM|nr:50S ribosomal protein L30 [Methylomonas lenta]OAI10040.1 50S ribosomal protein L30 [Methylomonas lenta]